MSDDLATKLQHRSADALAYLARYANYLDCVGSGVEAASVNRLRLDLSEVVVAVASTITRLRAKVETVLAGGREDRETIDALEAEAKIAGRMIYDEKAARLTAEARVQVLEGALGVVMTKAEAYNDPHIDEDDIALLSVAVRDVRRASAALAETKPVEHAKAGVGE